MKKQRRIAMWSGPRNISTAMMRAWGSRPDTVVCDEPFYAHYLKQTGYTYHPGYYETISQHEDDWQRIIQWLTGPLPDDRLVFFQKQMAQHLLPHIPLDWTDSLTNVLLIRDPREMLLSLLEFLPNPTLEETGLPQQLALFEREMQRTGVRPLVLDARDVLLDPPGMLRLLCNRTGIAFDDRMLTWQPGIHETDGVWAKYWYGNVAKTTSFSTFRPRKGELSARHRSLWKDCQELYHALASHKLGLPTNETR